MEKAQEPLKREYEVYYAVITRAKGEEGHAPVAVGTMSGKRGCLAVSSQAAEAGVRSVVEQELGSDVPWGRYKAGAELETEEQRAAAENRLWRELHIESITEK